MVQIKKLDRQVGVTGAEENKKGESSSKPRISKGIAESESKFEIPKQSSLFQNSRYSAARSTTIADGSSNTIVFGEQQTDESTQESSNDQQTSSGNVTDGTSNTFIVGEQSSESTQQQSTNPPNQDKTSGQPVFSSDATTTEGQSSVIVVDEEGTKDQGGSGQGISTLPSSPVEQSVTSKDESTTTRTSGESQQQNLVTIGDGSSRTVESEVAESTQDASSDPQESCDTSRTTEITDGTSNTIVVG